MDINDLYQTGSEIMDAVNDAVNRNDFEDLSKTIRKTVKEVSDTIQRDVRDYNEKNRREDVRSRTYRSTAGQGGARAYGNDPYGRYRTAANAGYGQRMNSAGQPQRRYSSRKTPFFQKLVSKQSGFGKIIGGIFGLVITIPMLLGSLAGLVAGGLSAGALFGVLATALIVGACAYWVSTGRKENELVKRYYEYGKAIGEAEYIDIAKLAHATGHTKEDVLSDIKALIDKKVFSQAWLDEQETTLMLTEEIYKQYQDIRAQSEMLRQQAEAEQASDSDLPAGARDIIKEGRNYIKTIHELNDEIPGVEINRVRQLEQVALILHDTMDNPRGNIYLPKSKKISLVEKLIINRGKHILVFTRHKQGLGTERHAFDSVRNVPLLLERIAEHAAEWQVQQDGVTDDFLPRVEWTLSWRDGSEDTGCYVLRGDAMPEAWKNFMEEIGNFTGNVRGRIF